MTEQMEEYEAKANHIEEPSMKVSSMFSVMCVCLAMICGIAIGLNAAERNLNSPCVKAITTADAALDAREAAYKYGVESDSVILTESKILWHEADRRTAMYKASRATCLK